MGGNKPVSSLRHVLLFTYQGMKCWKLHFKIVRGNSIFPALLAEESRCEFFSGEKKFAHVVVSFDKPRATNFTIEIQFVTLIRLKYLRTGRTDRV